MQLESLLDTLGILVAPCHNDLVAENFIKSEQRELFLIDWEYSGMNDPMWDIAALFLESNFSLDSIEYFLKAYFGHTNYMSEYKRIKIYQILMDWLWSLWTEVKEREGVDLGSYGEDRYNRAVQNLKKLHNEKL